jgi:hypothetical protein
VTPPAEIENSSTSGGMTRTMEVLARLENPDATLRESALVGSDARMAQANTASAHQVRL